MAVAGSRAGRVAAGPFAGALALALVLTLSGCATGEASAPSSVAPSVTGSLAPEPTTAPASTIPDGAFDEVLTLLVERLATGDAVAASKLFSGAPVTDEAREKAVLDAAATRAAEVGADADYVALVFADQISASKEVQQSLLDAWAGGTLTPPTTAPDLATEVRPVLDRITQSLVPALASVEQYRADPGCAVAVEAAASSATDAATTTPSAAIPSPTALAALPTATMHLCG